MVSFKKRLEEFVQSEHHAPINPKHHSFIYPLPQSQQTFDFAEPEIPLIKGLRARLGFFTESYHAAVFGGKLYHNHRYTNQAVHEEFFKDYCQIDVSRQDEGTEVKALRTGGDLHIKDHQIKGYTYALLDTQHKNPVNHLNWCVVRHSLSEFEKQLKELPPEEVLKEFSKSLLYAIVFPFSIVYAMHQSPFALSQEAKFGFRYETHDGKKFPSMSRIRSPNLDRLFFNPAQELDRLLLHPREYSCSRLRANKVIARGGRKRYAIPELPILVIKEINPALWLKNFRKSHESLRAEAEAEIAKQIEADLAGFFQDKNPNQAEIDF